MLGGDAQGAGYHADVPTGVQKGFQCRDQACAVRLVVCLEALKVRIPVSLRGVLIADDAQQSVDAKIVVVGGAPTAQEDAAGPG